MSGNNTEYRILYLEQVLNEDIPKLPKDIKLAIKRAIETRIALDPRIGKPLKYSLRGCRRVRVGDYRIVYRIEHASMEIIITAIKHRKDVYRT